MCSSWLAFKTRRSSWGSASRGKVTRSSLAALSSLVDIELVVTFRSFGSSDSAGSWRKVIRWRILRSLEGSERSVVLLLLGGTFCRSLAPVSLQGGENNRKLEIPQLYLYPGSRGARISDGRKEECFFLKSTITCIIVISCGQTG